jgi:hypothetical protein
MPLAYARLAVHSTQCTVYCVLCGATICACPLCVGSYLYKAAGARQLATLYVIPYMRITAASGPLVTNRSAVSALVSTAPGAHHPPPPTTATRHRHRHRHHWPPPAPGPGGAGRGAAGASGGRAAALPSSIMDGAWRLASGVWVLRQSSRSRPSRPSV